ncbi:MAG: glycosyltransferase [Elusimicrobia bacterium]|nr:glycosyltransferase [Elusimicrobiota bacterium]
MTKQLKILHIDLEKTWRGGQQQLFWLVEGLSKKGHKNFVICRHKSELFKKLSENNISFFTVKMLFELDPFAIYKTANIIEKIKPDIIHLHSAHAHTIGLLASKVSKYKPKLVSSRRVDFNIKSRWKYKSVNKIIAISEGVKKVLLEDRIPEHKISVVYSGVDLKRLENVSGDYLYEEFKIKKGQVIVGTVGALAGHKNYKNFIKSAEIVKKVIPEAIFFVVGKGELEQELKEYARELNMSDSIIFTGFRNDIPQILSIFTIFVLSSYKEGLCTSIIDGMASGLPIVATDVGGVGELVNNGVNGFLVPSRNPELLAEKIIKIIKEKDLWKKYSEASKIKSKEFSKEKMVDGTERIYTGLL